jgi:hypothetical protein
LKAPTLIELLYRNEEALAYADSLIAQHYASGMQGNWTIQVHHGPGGVAGEITVQGSTVRFKFSGLIQKGA